MNMDELKKIIEEAFDKERAEQEQMIANELKEETKKMSDREKVLLVKDLFESYKNTLNLTTAEIHEIEMWLEDKLGGEK